MVTYDITPEAREEIAGRIAASSDEHLGVMIGRTLLLIRDAETRDTLIEAIRLTGAAELTEEHTTKYNASIMGMLLAELDRRLGK